MSRVAIIEANAVYALGLERLVQDCGLGPTAVCRDVATAASTLSESTARIILLSAHMLRDFAGSLQSLDNASLVLVVDRQDYTNLADLQAIGFDGLLLRDASQDRIVDCLRTVASGHAWLDPALCGHLLHPPSSDCSCLSRRELEVAKLAAEGLSNKHIAKTLKLSDGTVKIHLHHVFAKLHVNKRSQLNEVLDQALVLAR